jgi:PPOX class probable F420-dependent enzyme
VHLTDEALALLRAPSICYLATTMPDGSPQLTQVWADTDGEQVIINTVVGFQKVRNVERDPRVAVTLSDPANPTRYLQIRGDVVEATTDGGADHIDRLSQKYLGRPYPWFGGRDQQRIILRIAPRKISGQG